MSIEEKVLDFPRAEVTTEESARRVMVEATPTGWPSAGRVAAVGRP
jgi:hypothetical protein